MKRWLIILPLAIFSLCCIAIGYAFYNYYTPPTERKAYIIPHHNDDTLRVAYIGDSWAAMHKEHECILAQIIEDSIHRPVKVSSFGIHGKTSKEIYENMFDNQGLHQFMMQGYDFCFISAGINDTYKKMSTDYYKKSMDHMIRFLLTNHIHPIILDIPPEHGGEHDCQHASIAQCLLEDIRKGHKRKTGTHTCLVRIHTDVEDGREDDEACHDGDKCVDECHVHSRLRQWSVLLEITGIGAEASHGKTERVECLSHGFQDCSAIDLAPIGFEQELHTLRCAGEHDGTNRQKDGDDEQSGHHQFGRFLNARLHTACDDKMNDTDEQEEPQGRHP